MDSVLKHDGMTKAGCFRSGTGYCTIPVRNVRSKYETPYLDFMDNAEMQSTKVPISGANIDNTKK